MPHFCAMPTPQSVNLVFDDGLNAVALDGSGRRKLIQVTGPGYYFLPGRVNVDDLRLSPDGQWVLAQVAQQLHLLKMPGAAGETLDVAQRAGAPQAHHGRRRLSAMERGRREDGLGRRLDLVSPDARQRRAKWSPSTPRSKCRAIRHRERCCCAAPRFSRCAATNRSPMRIFSS